MKLIARAITLLTGMFVVASILGALAATAMRKRPSEAQPPEADEIHLAATLEPLSFESTATAFRGGTIETTFGGGIVDLRKAVLDPAGARITVRSIFGGGQIVVPAEWRLVSEVRGIGGVGDGRPKVERPDDGPTLVIDGLVLFGGFGVTADVSEKDLEGLKAAVAKSAERARNRTGAGAVPVPEAG
jgi:hypothetical protein